jgi:hypothetical protein
MSTIIVQMLQPYQSAAGWLNAGEIVGFPSAQATALITAGTAVEYDGGTPAASPFRGIGEGELPAQYQALGGAADTTPSAAVEGYLNETTVLDGRAVPNSLVGDKLQG